jgi:methyl-accepting chemotaxis protein
MKFSAGSKGRISLGTSIILFICLIISMMALSTEQIVASSIRGLVTNQLRQSAKNNVYLLDQNLTQYLNGKMQSLDQLSQSLTAEQSKSQIQYTLNVMQGTENGEAKLYFIRKSGQIMAASDSAGEVKISNPHVRSWYKQVLSKMGTTVISAPYRTADDPNAMSVSIARAASDGSGVISMDLSLAKINSMVNKIVIGQKRHGFLLDQNHAWLANPYEKMGNQVTGNYLKAVKAKQSNGTSLTVRGQQLKLVFTTNSLTGWKVGGVVDNREVNNIVNPKMRIVYLISLVVLIIAALLTFVLTRKLIVKPLTNIVTVLERISKHNLTDELIKLKGKTIKEFTVLTDITNRMLHSLSHIIHVITSKAQTLAASSEELTASTEENKATSDEIAQSVQKMAAAAEFQTQQIKALTNEANAINQSVTNLSEKAKIIDKTGIQAQQTISRGQQTSKTATDQMNIVKQKIESLAETVDHLNHRSQQIGSIVKAVNTISDQTHLLSLNAAIEAAHAGEKGKGFAVVATEINKLSTQSATSVNEIGQIIDQMKQNTEQVVRSMNEGMTEVAKGMAAVSESDQSFQKISKFMKSASEEVGHITAEINRITPAMNRSIEKYGPLEQKAAQISSHAENISAATEQQSASMEEIANNATALSQVADELQQLVAGFKQK